MNNQIEMANKIVFELKNKDYGSIPYAYVENYAKGRLDSWKEELEFLESLKLETKNTTFAVKDVIDNVKIRVRELQSANKRLEDGLK